MKDAKGHGSNSRGLVNGMREKLQHDISEGRMIAVGPKSKPAPIHDSMSANKKLGDRLTRMGFFGAAPIPSEMKKRW